MADGWYQRTCRQCQHAWLVPAAIAEERPDIGSITSQVMSQIGATFDQQNAMRAHYQQLAAAARCTQCGATLFTQAPTSAQPVPDAPPPGPPAAPGAQPAGGPPPPPVAAAPATAGPTAPSAPASQPQTYVLNQALVSLTGDAWIEDGSGHRMYAVDGSLLSLRGAHVLKDLAGQPLYEVAKPLAPHMHKTISISRAGQNVANVQRALFNLAGDKFKIAFADGRSLSVRGDWMNREFQVVEPTGGQIAMTASRAWFTIHDAYGIQVAPWFDGPLALAIAIALERVEAEEHGAGSPVEDLLGGFNPF